MLFTHNNDVHLTRLLVDGNPQAFSVIFQKYHQKVFNAALYILGDENLSKKVVLDVFSSLWKDRPTLGNIGDLKKYLVDLSRTVTYEALRGIGKKHGEKELENGQSESSYKRPESQEKEVRHE